MRTHRWPEGPGLARIRDVRWGARAGSILVGVLGWRLIEQPSGILVPAFFDGLSRFACIGSEGRRSRGETEAREDFSRHPGIVDGGDQVHGDSTTRAAQRVHAEHTLEEFGPGEPPRSGAVRDGVEVIGAPRIAGGAKGARRTFCLSAWIHSEARIGGLGIADAAERLRG